jgi:general secretion pathway protein A
MMSSLYCAHFRLEETPFSMAPDPCFVYMSEQHREALGHLLYGLGEGGGFVQLTGEVGTGKTTICRTLLCQLVSGDGDSPNHCHNRPEPELDALDYGLSVDHDAVPDGRRPLRGAHGRTLARRRPPARGEDRIERQVEPVHSDRTRSPGGSTDPDNVDVALIFNPNLTVSELLETICEELNIEPAGDDTSTKAYVDRLYAYLLDANARGRRTILIIDEAQSLSRDVLEQIRLLTNLETNENKLLQIFLIGQPELRSMLARDDLRQLAQRITARYHLEPLSRAETGHYIRHRLSVAGCERKVFSTAAVRRIYRLTGGIPRLINSLCDRALLGAYTTDREGVNARIVRRADRELHGTSGARWTFALRYAALGCAMAAVAVVGILALDTGQGFLPDAIAHTNFAVAMRDLKKDLVERAWKQPLADSKSIAPEAVGSAKPTVMAALFPGEDANVALGPPATQAIDSKANALPVQTPAVRPAESDASRLVSAESRLLAIRRQGEASTRRTLGEHLDFLGSGASIGTEQRLFALWGMPKTPASGKLCTKAAERGLMCFAKSGSWAKLRGFDLPALLNLRADGGEPVHALLVGLAGQDATLYLGRRQLTFQLHEIDRYWTGDFMLLWKPPLERVTVIRPSHFGESVQWLRTIFARVDGLAVEARSAASFDAALAERVKDFQRRRGLRSDGIVGPETLIHLSTLIRDSGKPTLGAATVSAAEGAEPTVAYLRE